MRTINISVTENQQEFVDSLVARLGFANRSEFFRTVIRRIKVNPEVIDEPKIIKLSPVASKRYDKMIEDVESGRVKTFKADNVATLMTHLKKKK